MDLEKNGNPRKLEKRRRTRKNAGRNRLNETPQFTHIRHQYSVSGSWDYTLSKTESSYVIDFGNGYRFQISPQHPEKETIIFMGSKEQEPFNQEIRDHLIKNQINPMLRAWSGSLVFHASAIKYKNTVWGFLGNSGAGKSTLAKSLSNRPHIDHWSDDWLETEVREDGMTSFYNSFSIRLESKHAKKLKGESWLKTLDESVMSTGNKLLINDRQEQEIKTPTKLTHICEIIPCSTTQEFSLKKLKSSEAFRCVSQHLYRLDTTKTKHLQREFIQLTKLVAKLPIYRMHYPHSLPNLSYMHERIIEAFSN